MDFTNKNVVITGGSTGIGFATAKAFINAGANVTITSRSIENLQNAATEINNHKLKIVVSDTSSLAGIAILEKAIAESGNKVDVLFLNAGNGLAASIEQTTEKAFDDLFNVNVKGVFFTLQKMIPHLKDGSSVIITSSGASIGAYANRSVYSATKSAVDTIARVAATELADRKIRVNIVSPGPIQTERMDKVANEEVKKQIADQTVLQRIGNPDEIADAVLFLSSDTSSFITGTYLSVDGGYALRR